MNKKDNKPAHPVFFETQNSYDLTLEQLIEAVRQYAGVPDAIVTFDVAHKTGKVRGATVKFLRLEIKG